MSKIFQWTRFRTFLLISLLAITLLPEVQALNNWISFLMVSVDATPLTCPGVKVYKEEGVEGVVFMDMELFWGDGMNVIVQIITMVANLQLQVRKCKALP